MNDFHTRKQMKYHSEDSPHSKNKMKKWRRLIPLLLVLIVAVLAGGIWLALNNQDLNQVSIAADRQVNVGSGYRNITYKGKQYRYNNRITVILCAGLDSDTPLVKNSMYTIAPRADSISLIVMDELHKKMTIIALNRETMTRIRRYTVSGKKSGLYVDYLCYAYTYGDGDKASCDGLCEAVSMLLYNIPVNNYVIINRASMNLLSELIGPVEVTVPNNDLAEINGAFTENAKVTIDSSNVEMFVRHRDTTTHFSNAGRMQRQQAYITGAMNRFRKLMNDEPGLFWAKIQEAENYVQTNITRSHYLELTRIMNHTAFTNRDYYIPEGKQVAGGLHDEFYPDEEQLLQKVIELFYIEQ